MNKFKVLYHSGLFILLIAISVVTFFMITVTSSMDFGKSPFTQTDDEIEYNTSIEKVEPKVLKEIIKKDTIYIEKKVQVPCVRNHCETPAVNDSIVP